MFYALSPKNWTFGLIEKGLCLCSLTKVLSRQAWFTFVATNTCLWRQIFVALFCHDKGFVAASILLSQQKRCFVETNTRLSPNFCRSGQWCKRGTSLSWSDSWSDKVSSLSRSDYKVSSLSRSDYKVSSLSRSDYTVSSLFRSDYTVSSFSLSRFKVSMFFKVSRFYWAFGPWGLESEVTFTHDIPYEQVHGFY